MRTVKKALIPAAGLGTRFLPATKVIPKEMLTIVDAPIIFYVVEEAVNAGIEEIILIQGRGKHSIEDFFDISYELEDKLRSVNRLHLLDRLIKVRSKASIVSIRQKQALGLGHAVLCGKMLIGSDPFAILLGDEITRYDLPGGNNTESLIKKYVETGISTVSVMSVSDDEVSKYGITEVSPTADDYFNVTKIVEKPRPTETKSRWGVSGRYVFNSEIFDILKDGQPGLNGEIQLTDSMNVLAQRNRLHAVSFRGERLDAGDKVGFIKANIELGLANKQISNELREYIIHLAKKLSYVEAL